MLITSGAHPPHAAAEQSERSPELVEGVTSAAPPRMPRSRRANTSAAARVR